MAERASLYMVSVKDRYSQGEPRLLGDIDDAGTALRDVIAGIGNAGAEAGDDLKKLACAKAKKRGHDDLVLALDLSESGVVADIEDASGAHRLRRRRTDKHTVRGHALFRLPGGQRHGFAALHITDGRGYKTLLTEIVKTGIAVNHEHLTLKIEPVADDEVLRDAIKRDKISSITLKRWERPGDRALEATDKWVPAGEHGYVKVVYSAGRGKRLSGALFRRFWGEKDAEKREEIFNSLVTFQDIIFDEIKVEAQLPNHRSRTYNVRSPSGGHPVSIDLEDLETDPGDDGGFTEASIVERLTDLLDEKS